MATLEINENLSSEKYAFRHTMVLFICHKTRPFLSFEHCISDIHFADFLKIWLVEIESKRNAAINKPSMASSVCENHYGLWSPYYATDGIIHGDGVNIFHSTFETLPWITTDLQEVSKILFLRVYTRGDVGKVFIYIFIKLKNNSLSWFLKHLYYGT